MHAKVPGDCVKITHQALLGKSFHPSEQLSEHSAHINPCSAPSQLRQAGGAFQQIARGKILGKKRERNRQKDKKKTKGKKAEDAAKSSVIKWSRGELECGVEHGVLESGAAPQRSLFVALMVQMSKH